MGRYGDLDYARLTKVGFLLGLSLLVVGAAGELVGHAYFDPLLAWEAALFFDLELVGIVIGFVSPLVFGSFMPLTE